MNARKALLTAGEAAAQLGVAPATIQRWVDQGRLGAERTLGGHRRIPVAEIRRLVHTRPFHPQSCVQHWLDILMTGESYPIRTALLAARQQHGNWAAAADELASAIAELGRRWEVGLCQIFEEHRATEALRRAASSCANDILRSKGAPRAVLLTVEGERHTLGLSLAELVLAESGWEVCWIGEGPPSDELGLLAAKEAPNLFVVSASAASNSRAIAAYQDALVVAARAAKAALILGGAGTWRSPRQAYRASTFGELQSLVDRILQRVERKPSTLGPATGAKR
jgi:excisionase family DNA binding protein